MEIADTQEDMSLYECQNDSKRNDLYGKPIRYSNEQLVPINIHICK